jgi:hypothetical protein
METPAYTVSHRERKSSFGVFDTLDGFRQQSEATLPSLYERRS